MWRMHNQRRWSRRKAQSGNWESKAERFDTDRTVGSLRKRWSAALSVDAKEKQRAPTSIRADTQSQKKEPHSAERVIPAVCVHVFATQGQQHTAKRIWSEFRGVSGRCVALSTAVFRRNYVRSYVSSKAGQLCLRWTWTAPCLSSATRNLKVVYTVFIRPASPSSSRWLRRWHTVALMAGQVLQIKPKVHIDVVVAECISAQTIASEDSPETNVGMQRSW